MVEKTNLVKGNKLRTTIISKLVANEDLLDQILNRI